MKLIIYGVLMFSMLFSSDGYGQQIARSQAVDPNQTSKQIESRQVEKQRQKTRNVPDLRQDLSSATSDDTPLFVLKRVILEGATVFDVSDLADSYQPFLGRKVSEADLLEIVNNITDRYKEADFTLSRAILPPQDIENGTIHIRIVEGRIDEIAYAPVGARLHGAERLMAPVLAEAPLRLKTLERQLFLLSDTPGLIVEDTALEEIGDVSGRFKLTVYIESWRKHTELGVDNRGTDDVGPVQGYVSSSFNSVFNEGDTLAFSISSVPDSYKELGYSGVSYERPVGTKGARLGISASLSESRPGGARRSINTVSRTENYGANVSIVPLRSRETSLWLSGQLGLSDVMERDVFGTTYDDRIVTGSLVANLQHHDKFKGSNYLTTRIRQGFDLFEASREGDSKLSRTDGSGEFTKLQVSYTRYQTLRNDFSLRLSGAGQVSSRALLSSEEFFIGGTQFGRGYEGGALSGDEGIAGLAELRYDLELDRPILKHLQFYGFLDGGTVWNELNGTTTSNSLASAGGGVRVNLAKGFYAEFEAAQPLTYASSENLDKDTQFFFFLSKSFKVCEHGISDNCSESDK